METAQCQFHVPSDGGEPKPPGRLARRRCVSTVKSECGECSRCARVVPRVWQSPRPPFQLGTEVSQAGFAYIAPSAHATLWEAGADPLGGQEARKGDFVK